MIRPLLGLLALSAAPAIAEPASPEVETELRAMTQALVDAVAPGHAAVWDRYLDSNFLHLDENGTVRTRVEMLREIQPLPPGLVGSIRVDRFRAERTGDVIVAAVELQEQLDYHGQPRSRRVFLRDAAGRITGFADRREGEDIVWRRRD